MTMKNLSIRCCLALVLMNVCMAYGQQEKNDNTTPLGTAIASKHFAFVAQSAIPTGRRTIQLTGRYDLTVMGDTLIAALPYFGRADVAPVNPAETGTRFTSVNYTYNVKEKKKGGWYIEFVPKDAPDYRKLTLDVSPNGYATLFVLHNFRQPISFYGNVEP